MRAAVAFAAILGMLCAVAVAGGATSDPSSDEVASFLADQRAKQQNDLDQWKAARADLDTKIRADTRPLDRSVIIPIINADSLDEAHALAQHALDVLAAPGPADSASKRIHTYTRQFGALGEQMLTHHLNATTDFLSLFGPVAPPTSSTTSSSTSSTTTSTTSTTTSTTSTVPPTGDQFPNPATTGTPPGWTPDTTRSTDLTVTTPGQVIEDTRFTNGADLVVKADNVIVRRVDFQGGFITNQFGTAPQNCGHNLLVEDTTFEPVAGQQFVANDFPRIGEGSYTARRVEMLNVGEGFRASDCGQTNVYDSFALIQGASGPGPACNALHSDGIQAFFGRSADIRNDSFIFGAQCGTAPIWIPGNQGNTGTYTVNHVLVSGSGFTTRIGVPASVQGLKIVNNSWVFGPIDVKCSVVNPWEAKIVNISSDFAVTGTVRDQPCDTEGGL